MNRFDRDRGIRPEHAASPLRVPQLIAWLLGLLGLLAGEATVHAAMSSVANAGKGASPEVSVGFEGVYKTGCWTAVRVPVVGTPPGWVWADDPDAAPLGTATFGAQPKALASADGDGSERHDVVSALVRFGRPRGRIGLSPTSADGDRRAIDLPAPLPGNTPLLVVLGRLPSINRACQLLERPDGARPVAVQTSVMRLGDNPLELDAADALVVCGTNLVEETGGASTSAVRTVDAWVRRGGNLLLLAGKSALRLEASGPPMAGWLPGGTTADPTGNDGLAPLRRPVAVELFARATRPLAFAPTAPPRVPVFRSTVFRDGGGFDGTILLHEGQNPTDLPLVTRQAHGLGTITWVGLDLDEAPFVDWSGSESFLARLLADRFAPASSDIGPPDRAVSVDLAGQLRRAVDTFAGVTPVPFGVVTLLAIGHVAVLYPLSWWIAVRLTGSSSRWGEAAAWLVLPAAVSLFTCGSMAVGGRWLGRTPATNSCGVVDFDVAAGQVRVLSFGGAWSPDNATVSVAPAASPDVLDLSGVGDDGPSPATAVSWFADAGRSLGGADAPTAHPSLASHAYRHDGGLVRLVDVPIAAASSRLFEGRIDLDAVSQSGRPVLFEGRLERDPQGTLRGSLVSRLPFPLEDCRLAYSGWVYSLGTLASGGTFSPSLSRGPTSLAATLTRRTATGDREHATAYDRTDRDPWRILEVAGFFAAAGGESYTGLPAGRLGQLDVSPLLEANRAVLTGRGPAVVDWTVDGFPEDGAPSDRDAAGRRGVWRFVLPLGRTLEGSSSATSEPDRGTGPS